MVVLEKYIRIKRQGCDQQDEKTNSRNTNTFVSAVVSYVDGVRC